MQRRSIIFGSDFFFKLKIWSRIRSWSRVIIDKLQHLMGDPKAMDFWPRWMRHTRKSTCRYKTTNSIIHCPTPKYLFPQFSAQFITHENLERERERVRVCVCAFDWECVWLRECVCVCALDWEREGESESVRRQCNNGDFLDRRNGDRMLEACFQRQPDWFYLQMPELQGAVAEESKAVILRPLRLERAQAETARSDHWRRCCVSFLLRSILGRFSFRTFKSVECCSNAFISFWLTSSFFSECGFHMFFKICDDFRSSEQFEIFSSRCCINCIKHQTSRRVHSVIFPWELCPVESFLCHCAKRPWCAY